MMAMREAPKRGAKCDSCGAPATGLFYRWHGCDACIKEQTEGHERWAADQAAQRALDVP